jgi:hypothetical protein
VNIVVSVDHVYVITVIVRSADHVTIVMVVIGMTSIFLMSRDTSSGKRTITMTNNAERELLPCPFCGWGKVEIILDDARNFCAMCDNCMAMGSPKESRRGAVSSWQARAQASGVPDGLKVSRWVSDDLSFHFEIPFTSTLSTACDVERGDGSEQAEFLRALATALLSTAPTLPKSASVPVERLEALQRYTGGIQVYVLDSDLAELIAEYK